MRYTRSEVAKALGITPSRVSQIASVMNIALKQGGYSNKDVGRMMKRPRKPGPKPRGK